MAELHRLVSRDEIEQVIRRLRGVVSARVNANGKGEVEEIHVVGNASRNPKQLVRDIESALLSELGVRVDHRKVSIAQLKDEEEPVSSAQDFRLKFLHIDFSLDRASARAKVSLGRENEVFAGSARANGPEARRPQLVAQATLAAVEEYLRVSSEKGLTPTLELLDLVTHKTRDGLEIVLVTVGLLAERGKEELIGSALVKDDPWRATACATLDAMNRRLPALL